MLLENRGRNLYYDVQGKGEKTLLFVHGWMGSSSVWREQVSYFSKNYRVVTFDLTGFGLSDKPDDIDYTPDVWFEDIDAIISHLNIDKPILIGWSMGGAIGIGYTVTRPAVLSKLVLVSTTPMLVAPNEVFEYALPPEVGEQISSALQSDFSEGARSLVDKMFPEPESDSLKTFVHSITQQTTASIAIDSVINAGSADLRPLLNQIKIPCLILHGEADEVCAIGTAQYLFKTLPDAKIDTFKEKGHCPFLTDAQAFNEALASFIWA